MSQNRTLGRYELFAPLGKGGMGEVYRARDLELGREVAVKLLPPEISHDPEALARFKREARAVAALSHPNIVSIFDFGSDAGVSFAVMELLHGETLRSRLDRGPIDVPQAVEFGTEIAAGLAAAHAHGITHRDLKPENLFLTVAGPVKILDFGLAQVRRPLAEEGVTATIGPTVSGVVLGTVGYMSPEQVRGEPTTPASDVFSFGCVLYEMIYGQRAFARKSAAETLTAILHDEPPELATMRARAPATLELVLRRCLHKDAAARYASAAELVTDMHAVPSNREARRQGRSRRRSVRLALVLLAAAIFTVVGTVLLRIRDSGDAIDSLAVLPFVNAAGAAELDYLSDGISESIRHSLSQVSTLKVMARGSVSRYHGKEIDPRTAGRELDVRAVVQGEVSVLGDQLALNVELVDANDGRLLWGERSVRRFADVLTLQSEIAKQISDKLRLRLTRAQEARLTKVYTGNPEAYRFYLEGRFHSLQWSTEGLKKGVEFLDQAVAADPGYALAYAGLAAAYYDASGPLLAPSEAMPKAKAAAEKALALDDSLAEAHCALAQVLAQYEWNWAAAERKYQRSIAINPNYAPAHFYYGLYLFEQGRIAEARASLMRARDLDPLTPFREAAVAFYGLYMDRQYEEAAAIYKHLIEQNPDWAVGHYSLALVHLQQHRLEEAMAGLREAQKLDPENPFMASQIAYVHAVAGRREEAMRALAALRVRSSERFVDPFNFARIRVALGDVDGTFTELEAAATVRSEEVLFLVRDPEFDRVRSDPRFAALLHRVGLQP